MFQHTSLLRRFLICLQSIVIPLVALVTGLWLSDLAMADTTHVPERIHIAAVQSQSTPATSNQCFAQIMGSQFIYSSTDHTAVQSAVTAATTQDVVQVAGTCRGTSDVSGNQQVVYIDKSLTLRGGYEISGTGMVTEVNWANHDPASYMTTLDGVGSGRGVLITGTVDVTLDNLHFVNGIGGDGGAIYASQSNQITITNSTIQSSQAITNGGGIAIEDTTAVVLNNNQVLSNTAGNIGGGLYLNNNGQVTITAGTVLSNTAGSGGGLYAITTPSDSLLHISEILFAHNLAVQSGFASANGGGLYVSGAGTTVLSLVTITDNDASNGAGLYSSAFGVGLLTIHNSLIADNRASSNGGGLGGFTGNMTAMIHGTTIHNNQARDGGALHASASNLITITASTISSNTATSSGGGIAGVGLSGFDIVGTEMISNSAAGRGGAIGFGGGIDRTRISQTTIAYNVAADGGGIATYSSHKLTVTQSSIHHNTAENGGALYNQSIAYSYLKETTISHNTADFGGAFYNGGGSTISVTHSSIISNTSLAVDGALYGLNQGTTLALAYSIVAYSDSGDCGGSLNNIIDNGYNIVSDATCVFTATGSVNNTDPLLGALQDNGGGTWSHTLLNGSPALDGAVGSLSTADQRGIVRPQSGVNDIGSFEFTAVSTPTLLITLSNDDAVLNWVEDPMGTTYRVDVSTQPYSYYSLLADDVSSPMTVINDGLLTNYFYIVVAQGDGENTAESNRVGVFYFDLEPGE